MHMYVRVLAALQLLKFRLRIPWFELPVNNVHTFVPQHSTYRCSIPAPQRFSARDAENRKITETSAE